MNVNGIAAVVTGGASGLGGAAARRLAAAGAKVTIFDINEDLARAHAKEIGGHAVRVDVTSEADVASAIAEAEERHGKARVLVNCAGVATPGKALNRDGSATPLQDFARIINVNLIGTFNVLSKFAARIHDAEPIGEERGVIINTASVAAYEGQVGQVGYAASKGGVVGMTLPVAREFARIGIRVVSIAPGVFLTPMLAGLPQDVQDSIGKQAPFPNRLGHPDEYAMLVESVIANPMLNGETIRLDAAIRMAPK